MTAALVTRKQTLTKGGRAKCIPTNQNCARLLGFEQAKQKIGEAHDGAATAVTRPPDGFWQSVVGAVRKRIAVDGKQRLPHPASHVAQPADSANAQRAVGGLLAPPPQRF